MIVQIRVFKHPGLDLWGGALIDESDGEWVLAGTAIAFDSMEEAWDSAVEFAGQQCWELSPIYGIVALE